MNPIELIQDSDEWFQYKLGKVGGSRIPDLMARTKSGWGASRDAYSAELICERLTGQRYEKFKSKSMERGNEVEDDARAAYAFLYDVDPVPVGFVDHPTIAMAGSSPDRLVGESGLLEIKSPDSHTHLASLLGASIPGAYVKQMQWAMACTGRHWGEFVSFDPRCPEHMSLLVKRVHRDNAMIREIAAAVVTFLIELDRQLKELKTLFEPKPDFEAVANLEPLPDHIAAGLMP